VRDAAVASPTGGQLDVFALDADGRIWHQRRGSLRGRGHSWSVRQVIDSSFPWQVIDDAPEASAMAAVSHEENCQTLVAATDDGVKINSWHHKDGWIGWHPLSEDTATDIACSSSEPGQADFFTLGADGTIAHCARSQAGDWTRWTDVPGPGGTVTAITATAPRGRPPGLTVLTSEGMARSAGGGMLFGDGRGGPGRPSRLR